MDKIWKRKTTLLFLFIGVVATLVSALAHFSPEASILCGLGVLIVGALVDIAFLLDDHDRIAKEHYTTARQRYASLEKLEARVATRVLGDIDSLVREIEDDIVALLASQEPKSTLFRRMLKLDLQTLESRLRSVRERNQLPLDTHQNASHVIVCSALRDEGIGDFCAIYDVRASPIELHSLDLSFTIELDALVREKLVSVRGFFILSKGEDASALVARLALLHQFYASPGYDAFWVSEEAFVQSCTALGLFEVLRIPDVGFYGDRYVYQAMEPDPRNLIPRGTFLRDPSVVATYRELVTRLARSATHVEIPPVPGLATRTSPPSSGASVNTLDTAKIA